jgi:hypothetical protein
MGGVSIDENMLIDKTIHNAINSKSAVLKVCNAHGPTLCAFIFNCFIKNYKKEICCLTFVPSANCQ